MNCLAFVFILLGLLLVVGAVGWYVLDPMFREVNTASQE